MAAIKTRIEELEAALAAKESELSAALSANEGHASALAERDDKISALTEERDNYKASADQFKGELEKANSACATLTAEVTELRGKEQDLDKRASAKALEIAASQGLPQPVEIKPEGTAPSASKPVATAPNLTGLEKAIAAHKAAIKAK